MKKNSLPKTLLLSTFFPQRWNHPFYLCRSNLSASDNSPSWSKITNGISTPPTDSTYPNPLSLLAVATLCSLFFFSLPAPPLLESLFSFPCFWKWAEQTLFCFGQNAADFYVLAFCLSAPKTAPAVAFWPFHSSANAAKLRVLVLTKSLDSDLGPSLDWFGLFNWVVLGFLI